MPARSTGASSRGASFLIGVLFTVALALFGASALAAGPPETAPSASTSASPAHVASPAGASAHIRDRQVFTVKVSRNGRTAAERAEHATETLEHAAEDHSLDSASSGVHVEQDGDVAVVYVGTAPVIQLGPDDAVADGDDSVAVHAAVIAGRVREAIHAEHRRSAIATTVFSISLLVFSALLVFLALGKLAGLVSKGRDWVASRPSSIPSVRVAGIDVLRPTALRGVALGAFDTLPWLIRLGLGYGWILFALSLFDVTRAYSERLTGLVLAPLAGIVSRFAATMPVLFIGAVGTLALLLSLRVVALFFEGVTRGEPHLSWLPADLAAPTSLLLRVAIVVVTASVATPFVTGNEDGPLARASVVAIGALALALTPLLASAAVGVTVLFGRQLKVGDFVELGGRYGVVRAVLLLGVTIEDAQGCTVRVPHLRALVHPTRVLGAVPPVVVEVRVDPVADVASVTAILARAAEQVGIRGRVELSTLDADAAVYLVTVLSASATARSELLTVAARELKEARVSLGRGDRSAGAA